MIAVVVQVMLYTVQLMNATVAKLLLIKMDCPYICPVATEMRHELMFTTTPTFPIERTYGKASVCVVNNKVKLKRVKLPLAPIKSNRIEEPVFEIIQPTLF